MTPDRMTTLAQQALASAQQMALTRQHPEVMGLHVLAALLEDKTGTARSILERAGVKAQQNYRERAFAFADNEQRRGVWWPGDHGDHGQGRCGQ